MWKKMMGTLALSLATGIAGCQDATGPEEGAVVQIAATGDAEVSSSQSLQPRFSRSSGAGSSAEGTVEFTARVYLQNNQGSWIDLTEASAVHASVDAGGSQGTKTFHSHRVDAGSYTRARIVFERVSADLKGELRIGLGETLTGEVQVNVGTDGETTVEREIVLNAESGAETTLLIDLNSSAWLSRADRQSKSVAEADFQSAVKVVTR